MEGFSIQTISDVIIANNPFLERINLQPFNITGSLIIQANGRDLEVSMPNIEFGRNMAFWNCTGISTPSLRRVDDLTLIGNYITVFDGAPLLREVEGDLTIADNADMRRIALPELQTIAGNFVLRNNTQLEMLDTLYSLQSIDGDVILNGAFNDISFPGIDTVGGSFTVRSTSELSCDSFDRLYGDGVIDGAYACDTASDTEVLSRPVNNDESTSSSPTGPPNAPGGLSAGTKIGIGVGIGLGVALLIAALLFFLWRRRKSRRPARGSSTPEKDGVEIDRANMPGNDVQKHELEEPTGEMPVGGEAQELPSKHGRVEIGPNASQERFEGVESRHEMPVIEASNKTSSTRLAI